MADLIDRDLTIHELEAFRESCIANLLRMSFDDITDVVKEIPSVNRWIPCSERMPTMNEMRQSDCVLVCALDENWIGMAYYIGDGWAFADAQTKPRLETVEITHWMPLPEIPEPEKE